MVLMRQLLGAQKPGLYHYSCQAHIANLLAQDCVTHKNNEKVVNKVVQVRSNVRGDGIGNLSHQVCKAFRAVHALAAGLKKAGVRRPPLPCATRWNSIRDTLLWYNVRWARVAQISASNLGPGHTVRMIVETSGLRQTIFLNSLAMKIACTQQAGCGPATGTGPRVPGLAAVSKC
eukprot:EG_transcript_19171